MSITIAIVEDDHEVRRLLVGWINRSKEFHCVSESSSAESALVDLPAVKPDIVLMDINLPALEGIECVRRLKPKLPNSQFIVLTVYEDAEHIFSALAAGASGYILKRTSCNELIAALKDVMQGGSPMTSSIARKVVQSFQRIPYVPNAEGLSAREHEVLKYLARGYSFKEISSELGLTGNTISTYVRRIYEKLQVHSRSQAVATYVQFSRERPTTSP